MMGASRYERDRKRIIVESQGRSQGWKKRALKRLNDEQDLYVVRRGGKVVGVRQRDSDLVICRKKTFHVESDALRAIEQAALMGGSNRKPCRAYQCFHCSLWHVTSWHAAPVNLDDGTDS